MAEKIVFQLEIDEKGAVKSLDKIEQGVEDIGKTTEKTKGGLKSFGTTLGNLGKAAGIIGLISFAIDIMRDAFKNNQQVMDVFNTVVTSLSIIVNDFFNFIIEASPKVINFFKGIFDDPQQAIKDLGNAIKDNIIERFNSVLDVLGFVGSAFKKFLAGDFKGAMDDVGAAGKEMVDVYTGVNNSVDKLVEGTNNLIDAVVEYGTETIKTADAIVQQEKAMANLELQQTRVREAADRDAEKQRQIRDDDLKGIEERIAANDELARVLKKQGEDETASVNKRIAALQTKLSLDKNNQELLDEIYSLETERIAIQAQQAGFESEQLVNKNSLLKEQQENLLELREIGLTDRELAEEALQVEADRLAELAEKTITDEQELNATLEDIEQQHQDKLKGIDDKAKADQKKADESEAANQKKLDQQVLDAKKIILSEEAQASLAIASTVFNTIAGFAEEGTNLAKAAGIAGVIVDTISGGIKAFNAFAAIPIVGPALGAVAAAAVGVSGALSVQKIANTKLGTKTPPPTTTPNLPTVPTSGGGGGEGQLGDQTPPEFKTQGASDTNQLANLLSSQSQTPIKTYVLIDDVNTAQSAERNAVNNAQIN